MSNTFGPPADRGAGGSNETLLAHAPRSRCPRPRGPHGGVLWRLVGRASVRRRRLARGPAAPRVRRAVRGRAEWRQRAHRVASVGHAGRRQGRRGGRVGRARALHPSRRGLRRGGVPRCAPRRARRGRPGRRRDLRAARAGPPRHRHRDRGARRGHGSLRRRDARERRRVARRHLGSDPDGAHHGGRRGACGPRPGRDVGRPRRGRRRAHLRRRASPGRPGLGRRRAHATVARPVHPRAHRLRGLARRRHGGGARRAPATGGGRRRGAVDARVVLSQLPDREGDRRRRHEARHRRDPRHRRAISAPPTGLGRHLAHPHRRADPGEHEEPLARLGVDPEPLTRRVPRPIPCHRQRRRGCVHRGGGGRRALQRDGGRSRVSAARFRGANARRADGGGAPRERRLSVLRGAWRPDRRRGALRPELRPHRQHRALRRRRAGANEEPVDSPDGRPAGRRGPRVDPRLRRAKDRA